MKKIFETTLVFVVAISFLCGCATVRTYDGVNAFAKETALTGKRVNIDMGSESVKDMAIFGDFLFTLSQLEDDMQLKVYSISADKVSVIASFMLPESKHDYVWLFRTDRDNYLCGVFNGNTNACYGLTKDLRMVKLVDIEKKISKHIDPDIRYFPVCDRGNVLYLVARLFTDSGSRTYGLYAIGSEGSPVLKEKLQGEDYPGVYYAPFVGDGYSDSKGKLIVFGYSFFKELRFINTANGKTRRTIFNAPGYDTEIDLYSLKSQKKYYGQYISVGDKVYVRSFEGKPVTTEADWKTSVLEVFSRSGKPLERFIFDRCGRFAVDMARGRVFLVSPGSSPQLFMYKPIVR